MSKKPFPINSVPQAIKSKPYSLLPLVASAPAAPFAADDAGRMVQI
jgi:hypothetical protein